MEVGLNLLLICMIVMIILFLHLKQTLEIYLMMFTRLKEILINCGLIVCKKAKLNKNFICQYTIASFGLAGARSIKHKKLIKKI